MNIAVHRMVNTASVVMDKVMFVEGHGHLGLEDCLASVFS